MTTKDKGKKTRVTKPAAEKARAAKAKDTKKSSIGFLRASEKAHIAVMDIPLDFFADLGMFPDRIKSTKKMTRRFITGMYDNVDSVSTKIDNAMGAPGRAMGRLADRLREGSATPKSVVRPKAKAAKAKAAKAKSAAKKAESKAKGKVTAKAKTTAAKAKDKAKGKAKAAAAKPKAIVATPSRPDPNAGIH